MADERDEIDAAALSWAVRTGDPDFTDWEGLAAWLEADPRHAAQYHAVSADLADMTERLASPALPEPANDDARPVRRRWLVGAALAASVAALVGLGVRQGEPSRYAVETAPGTHRTLALADGSRVALNGATRILLDRSDPRRAEVERGEALFTVRHDAARPFRVEVGGRELVDVGTAFDVTRDGGTTRVAVAEGAVIYDPQGAKVRLDPGRTLRVADGTGQVELGRVPAESVGGWQVRRLTYAGAPLSEVAGDLSRALGTRVTASAAVAGRPFRGTLRLDGLLNDPAGLGLLLDARVRRTGDGWEIDARP